MSGFSTADYLALAWFALAWAGYSVLMEFTPIGRRGLNRRMDRYRLVWMENMQGRDLRIVDSQIMTSLQKEKKHAGTMLLAPFDVAAKSAGFNLLQKAIDVYGHYQGLVGATRRAWARDNEQKLVGYIRGYLAGLAWLYEAANKDEAIAILRKNLPQMSPEVAAASYGRLINPDGFAPKAEIDMEGVKTVLGLRSQYGQPKKALGDPAKYYDPKYYEAALK